MTLDDIDDVAELSGQLGYPASSTQIRERFGAIASNADAVVLVAESEEGRIAGWIHVYGQHVLESDAHAEVGGLVVSAGARRQGVGRILIDAAEQWARKAGYASVRVRSNVVRGEARAFYEAQGYQIIKTQTTFRKAL